LPHGAITSPDYVYANSSPAVNSRWAAASLHLLMTVFLRSVEQAGKVPGMDGLVFGTPLA